VLLCAASASTRPQPKWLFGRTWMPPHPFPFWGTVTFGFAVEVSRVFVAAICLTRPGLPDQRSATTPTTCGPAIEVPWKTAYALSLLLVDDLVLTPGAAMSGLMRPDPSVVTGPRLLKLASAFVDGLIAPVENDAA
jgi:hypothetical protein